MENNKTLQFMHDYISENTEFTDSWKVVALLDYLTLYFNKEMSKEEIEDILSKIEESYDDYTYTDEEEEVTDYHVYDSSDVDNLISDARYDAINDEKWRVSENLQEYMDWDSYASDLYGSIYDIYNDSDIYEFSYVDTYGRESNIYVVEEKW